MEQIFSTTSFTVNQLIEKIDTGELGLPELQRPFVWQNTKVRDLFDSMLCGYPVGYLMFWECPYLEKKKVIGMDSREDADPKDVIIDGQQRLTSLYAVMKGKKVIDANYREREIIISFCPLTNKFEVGTVVIQRSPVWIYNISDLLMGSSSYSYINQFAARLSEVRQVTDEERDLISQNIEAVFHLKEYSFPVFRIKANADEEAVSQVFVRINSEGTNLTENDFILTLLSVHWAEGRNEIEHFCRESLTPSSGVTSYNSIGIKIQPKHIIRTVMAYAFNRARLDYCYKLLRGSDFDHKRVISTEIMRKNFDTLKSRLPEVMDINNWHEFLKAVINAGYLYDTAILSKNALYYTYSMYLIAKYRFNAPYHINSALTSLWFFCAECVSLYSGSTDAIAESHLNAIKNLSSLEDYRRFIVSRLENRMTNDYFNITLPGSDGLAVSGSGNSAWYAYVASLNVLGTSALFSRNNIPASKLFESGSDGTRKALEKHHLFPRSYLKEQGYPDTQTNQMANYAYIGWHDNAKILDNPPDQYYPIICRGMTHSEIMQMEDENALPHGWEKMNYDEFLVQRRKLMAQIIRRAFELLKDRAKT